MQLSNQTYLDFNVHISNANLNKKEVVDQHVRHFSNKLNISVSHDGNDEYAFRRFTVGKRLAMSGTEAILFIDDDIAFGSNYIKTMVDSYEPKTYKSAYTWTFGKGSINYYTNRTRVFDNSLKIHYCGTGVSIIDASIFLEDGIFNKPKEAVMVEDLWLSYYAQHVMNWKLEHIHVKNLTVGGGDSFALHRKIRRGKVDGSVKYDKTDLLKKLVYDYGWDLS